MCAPFLLVMIVWIWFNARPLSAVNDVESLQFTTTLHTDATTSDKITITLWFNFTIYQYSTVGVFQDTTYTAYKQSLPQFTVLGSECSRLEANDTIPSKMMIQNHGTNAVYIDSVRFDTISGDWYGIDSICINTPAPSGWHISWRIFDNVCGADHLHYSDICIDTQTEDCYPSKHVLHFDTLSPNQYTSTALWTDGTNITPIATTCPPTSTPTAHPTNNPTLPTTTPVASPTKNPTLTTTNPTFAPTNETNNPTAHPTHNPTLSTINPTSAPTNNPTLSTEIPTLTPTVLTHNPTNIPSKTPTHVPTIHPTATPSVFPSRIPTFSPTKTPSTIPSPVPTVAPTPSPTLPWRMCLNGMIMECAYIAEIIFKIEWSVSDAFDEYTSVLDAMMGIIMDTIQNELTSELSPTNIAMNILSLDVDTAKTEDGATVTAHVATNDKQIMQSLFDQINESDDDAMVNDMSSKMTDAVNTEYPESSFSVSDMDGEMISIKPEIWEKEDTEEDEKKSGVLGFVWKYMEFVLFGIGGMIVLCLLVYCACVCRKPAKKNVAPKKQSNIWKPAGFDPRKQGVREHSDEDDDEDDAFQREQMEMTTPNNVYRIDL
eukprot:2245_1